jgi:ABC-type antimicrobial peptide transport system permease subunit
LAQSKTQVLLSTAFALASLLLAAAGLYGAVRHAEDSRRHDFAIRIALGATDLELTKMRLRQTLGTVALGLASGLLLSVASGSVARSMLFGVPAVDPLMLALAAALLLLVALLASYASIRATARLDPAELLRAS